MIKACCLWQQRISFSRSLSSYIALQFTGSTTFTSMSGVKKELKIAVPVYLTATALSLLILTIYKLSQWRVI